MVNEPTPEEFHEMMEEARQRMLKAEKVSCVHIDGVPKICLFQEDHASKGFFILLSRYVALLLCKNDTVIVASQHCNKV